jgi:chemotaxis response regulator CheB
MLNPLAIDLPAADFPRLAPIVIIGSAGGISAVIEILRGLEPMFAMPIIIVQHLSRSAPSILPAILTWHTGRAVKWAEADELLASKTIYVVPAAHALEIDAGRFQVSRLRDNALSWLDVPDRLLCSLSAICAADTVAIVLSGMLPAGVQGLHAVRAAGGIVMAQSESSSEEFEMPCAGIDRGKAEMIFAPQGIAAALNVIAEQRLVRESSRLRVA